MAFCDPSSADATVPIVGSDDGLISRCTTAALTKPFHFLRQQKGSSGFFPRKAKQSFPAGRRKNFDCPKNLRAPFFSLISLRYAGFRPPFSHREDNKCMERYGSRRNPAQRRMFFKLVSPIFPADSRYLHEKINRRVRTNMRISLPSACTVFSGLVYRRRYKDLAPILSFPCSLSM